MRPRMEDRAHFFARAVLAICVSALVNCPERSPAFPLADYDILSNRLPENRDLKSSCSCFGPYSTITHLPTISPSRKTPLHTHFTTDPYLRYIWAHRNNLDPGTHGLLGLSTIDGDDWHNSLTAAVADLLLAACLFSGHRPKVKRSGIWVSRWCFWLHSLLQKLTTFLTSDHLEAISTHVLRAVITAIHFHPTSCSSSICSTL